MLSQVLSQAQTTADGAAFPRSQWAISPETAAEVWANFQRPEWKKPGGVETLFTLRSKKTGETARYSFCSDAPLTFTETQSAILLLTGARWQHSLVALECRPFEF